MANQVVQVPTDGTGKKFDTEELTVGVNTVERARGQIAGAAATEIARVQATTPDGTEMALVTRNIPSGTQTVSGTVAVTGVATDATITTTNAEIGGLTEAAPSSDTASSGLNGRLQRIAQRLTSLIALLPSALTGSGNLKVAIVESTATQAVTVSGTLATSVADGANVTIGTTTDAEAAGNGTVIALLKRLRTLLGGTLTVSGTVTANAGTGTLAVSAASLPLPSGAATSAKQPALGTAGSASADVLSVQGIASGTALKVDGSTVTQPVSGTVTANAGTGTLSVKDVRATTGTVTSPSATTTSSTILAANANRLGATIWNEGSAELYLKFGATASVTSYAVRVQSADYYEVPFVYTGIIDGITASGTAQCRVTELT